VLKQAMKAAGINEVIPHLSIGTHPSLGKNKFFELSPELRWAAETIWRSFQKQDSKLEVLHYHKAIAILGIFPF